METKKPCNIGPKEIRRRQATGMIALILTSILSVAFVLGGTEWYWYLILLLPSFGAMEGALQVKEKTWVILAARGLRSMDEGEEKVNDPAERQRLKKIAKSIHLKSALVAIVFTALMALIAWMWGILSSFGALEMHYPDQ